ncbi:reverse transcriptase [bacterium]|nr:reverse transcriptase [bacterium]
MAIMEENLADIFSFLELVKAHRRARRGKGGKKEIILCELDLAKQLLDMRERTLAGKALGRYHSFRIFEPKEREINALNYEGRVLQHCLCDQVLAPVIEPRLIYDNAACRAGKGTHFAIYRLSEFLREHYRRCGQSGYFLKCDIRRYFACIDHDVLKQKLARLPFSGEVRRLIDGVIDSFRDSPGKGLPLGNQSSQWFALYYLDSLDRLIKEKLGFKHYVRYMDDCIIVHPDKRYLQECLDILRAHVRSLALDFNGKTQIIALKKGVGFLGFNIRLTETGKVLRTVRAGAKHRMLRYIQRRCREAEAGRLDYELLSESLNSICAHLAHGHAWYFSNRLQARVSSLRR